MNEIAVVTLGSTQTTALRKSGNRLTKTWLRDYLRTAPHTDFVLRNTAGPLARWCGKPVSGRDAIRMGLTIEVHDDLGRHVASVEFQTAPDANQYGYQAVVR